MQQKPVNSSSRTYQAKGSPGGEWQSLIPLGWCRDQLRVIRQSYVIHYYHHEHLHGKMKGLKSSISLKARKHPTAHTNVNIRGSRSSVSHIPWLCRERWLLCQAKGPVFQQTWRFFSSLFPYIFPFPYSSLWINRARTLGILLLGEKEPISNGKYSNQSILKILSYRSVGKKKRKSLILSPGKLTIVDKYITVVGAQTTGGGQELEGSDGLGCVGRTAEHLITQK